jgi:hypothetical protein
MTETFTAEFVCEHSENPVVLLIYKLQVSQIICPDCVWGECKKLGVSCVLTNWDEKRKD